MKLVTRIKLATIAFLLFSGSYLYAQQDAMYSQYMFNTLSVNPAYAGSLDNINLILLHRTQWVGFDGAPNTQSLTVHSPISKKGLGLGLSVVRDAIGPVTADNIFVDIAYKIKVHEGGYLSFGLKAGIDMRSANLTSLNPVDKSDPSYYADAFSGVKPNFGGGVFYYAPKWYLGASTPKISKTAYVDGGPGETNERHYFFLGGMVIQANEYWKLRPSILAKAVKGAPASVDLTFAAMYYERIIGGLSYRFGDSFGLMTEVRVFQQLWIGYAYDFSVTEMRKFNSGTHEIMLYWDFNTLKTGIVKSPRFF